jgi:hypothetical protein
VTVPDRLLEQEMALQADQRSDRVSEFVAFHDRLHDYPDGGLLQEALVEFAGQMRLDVRRSGDTLSLSSHRPGIDRACSCPGQADSVRSGPASGARSREGIRGQRRRHGGDEGVLLAIRAWCPSTPTLRRRAASKAGVADCRSAACGPRTVGVAEAT